MKRFKTVIVSAQPSELLGGYKIKQRVFWYSSSKAALTKAHCLVYAGVFESNEFVIQASIIDTANYSDSVVYRNESNYERFDELLGDWQEEQAL